MERLNAWAGPVLFGLLIYSAIDNYTGYSDLGYNRQVAGYVFIAAATLLAFATLTGRRFSELKPVLPLALALTASVALSTWWAPNAYFAANRDHLYYAVALLGIGCYLAHRGNAADTVWRYFTIVPLVHMVFLIIVVFYLISIQSNPDPTFSRFPDFANIRHFAYFGFISASCATSLFVLTRRLQSTAFVLTAAALFGIALLGARGALLAWIVFVVFFAFFCEKRRRFLLFCLAALALAAGVTWYLGESGLLRTPSLFMRLEPGGSGYEVSDRIDIWIHALRAIVERPWFGYGPEGYIASQCCNPHVAQPHNFILQFLLEFGVIGVALMIATGWSMVRACGGWESLWTDLRGGDAGLLAVCAVLAGFFAYALVDGLFYHAIPLTHFALFAALFFAGMGRSNVAHVGAVGKTGEVSYQE